MNLISRDELKGLLDEGADIKLVFALGEWAYRAKHIPSLHFATTWPQGSQISDWP